MAVWRGGRGGGSGGSSCLLGEEWLSRELHPLTSFVDSTVLRVCAPAHVVDVVVLHIRAESPRFIKRYDE